MIINNQNVRIGMSVGNYDTDAIKRFIEAGFECFESTIPARLPDPNPLAKTPEERRKTPYNFEESYKISLRGYEEELVDMRRYVLETIRNEGIDMWSIHLPFGGGWDIAHNEDEFCEMAVEGNKRIMDLTAMYKPKLFVLHGCLEPVGDAERGNRIQHSIESIKKLEAYAQKYNAHIALEDLPRSCLGNTVREIKRMSDESGVGICFDVNHLLQDSHELFLDKLESKIVTTHLSDYDGIDERHWLPGDGIVPWKMLFDRLQLTGYTGPYLFELKGLQDPYNIIEKFKKAVK